MTAALQPARRRLLRSFGLGGLAAAAGPWSLGGCAARGAAPTVVVVGGGYGGATAAKYLRLLSDARIDVVLVEPEPQFVSCPLSNRVVAGFADLADLTRSRDALTTRHGVRRVRARAEAIDVAGKRLRTDDGATLRYDKLLLSPGVDLLWDSIDGAEAAHASGRILQAWKAGPETVALWTQLQAMPDGGVFAITIPEQPYRCPPGPYERASLVAAYLKRSKPRAKVLVLDANPDVVSKGPLFKKAWAELYPGMVEYRSQYKTVAVDARTLTAQFEVQSPERADVLNVLPAMRAGRVAVDAGLANSNGRWCAVDFRSFASTAAPDVHVIGDAIQAAPAMPKSGHMANAHGKVAAAAIVAALMGLELDPQPMLTNTCYSFVADDSAIHVASVHAYVEAHHTLEPVPGAGGVSAARSEAEARNAIDWAHNIWADMLG